MSPPPIYTSHTSFTAGLVLILREVGRGKGGGPIGVVASLRRGGTGRLTRPGTLHPSPSAWGHSSACPSGSWASSSSSCRPPPSRALASAAAAAAAPTLASFGPAFPPPPARDHGGDPPAGGGGGGGGGPCVACLAFIISRISSADLGARFSARLALAARAPPRRRPARRRPRRPPPPSRLLLAFFLARLAAALDCSRLVVCAAGRARAGAEQHRGGGRRGELGLASGGVRAPSARRERAPRPPAHPRRPPRAARAAPPPPPPERPPSWAPLRRLSALLDTPPPVPSRRARARARRPRAARPPTTASHGGVRAGDGQPHRLRAAARARRLALALVRLVVVVLLLLLRRDPLRL